MPLDENDVRNTPVSNSDYTLFRSSPSSRPFHVMNYYLHRSPPIRDLMRQLWNQGKNIKNYQTLQGASLEQKVHHRLNVLFRQLESHGTNRTEFSHFTYDRQNDLYHCHVNDGKPTYVVSWEIDEEKRIINIVQVGKHENFPFDRRHKKADAMEKIEDVRKNDRIFQEHSAFLLKQRVTLPATMMPKRA